ncbi:hypothetical protein PG999_001954 [Apiospora kogelbergensis]|uniref:Trichothecene 3-O-acetyltransferase-like N-terminal domain-containing protein n=1 Tax=Apiospora kogelbergensis TaxID=1337665 RepID=A0AAW0R706_9PEZI
MQSKTEPTASGPRRFALNPLDNVMPRFYANFILTFALQPGVEFSEVHTLLQTSLHTAGEELPIIRRRVFSVAPDDKHPNAGRLEAREHPDWSPQVIFNDLSSSWPEYDDLVDEGLPQEALDGAQLVPSVHARWDLGGEGAPGCIVQANFITGGLLLSVCLFHSLVDGMSGSLLLKMWAKHMRLHQGDDQGAASLVITENCCDYDCVGKAWEEAGHKKPSPVEFANSSEDAWRLLGMLPPLSPEELAATASFTLDSTAAPPSPKMTTTIFYVSPAAFSKLTAMAAAAGENASMANVGTQGDNVSLIPTANDALMALLWRCVMRARQTADPGNPAYAAAGARAELDTTVDGRGLFSERLPSTYMGTLLFIATTRMEMTTLVSRATPLAAVARAVRQAVAAITRPRLHAAYGLAAAMPDFSAARYPFATFAGAEACFTSFLALPLMEMRFGGRLFRNGGLVDYLRPPRREFDIVCRRCVILPPRPSGGFEILLSLKEEEMEILENDIEFGEFAQVLCH